MGPSTLTSTAKTSADAVADGSTEVTPHVLIVDDDEFARTTLGYILSRAGIHVEHARNGMEALALARGHRYHTILMDVQMPGMDGPRALAMLRRDPANKNTPVIMISAYASSENVRNCVRCGASDFVVKQALNPEALIGKIVRFAAGGSADAISNTDTDKREPATGLHTAVTDASIDKPANASSTDSPAAASPTANQADDTPMDAETWKKKITQLGRSDREQTRAALADMALPAVVPGVLSDILQACANPQTPTEKLVRLIEQDPCIMLAVLHAANKGVHSANEGVSDTDAALRRIGAQGLQEVITNIRPLTGTTETLAPWLHRWWRHALAVGSVAGELCLAADLPPAVGRVAGLLHDIGRLILLLGPMREKTIACYDLVGHMIFPTATAEQLLFGLNHKQIAQDFVDRQSLPPVLRSVVTTHDMDDAQLARVGGTEQQLGAVVMAADQIVKAAGAGGLTCDELLPLPSALAGAATELDLQIAHVLDDIRKITTVRLGSQCPPWAGELRPMPGITVAMVSPQAGPWNPYQRALMSAGATVSAYSDPKVLLEQTMTHDVLVIDMTSSALATSLPVIRRICSAPGLQHTPRLLLARRSDEPELVVRQSGLDLQVQSTPIRNRSLLQNIRKLAGQ